MAPPFSTSVSIFLAVCDRQTLQFILFSFCNRLLFIFYLFFLLFVFLVMPGPTALRYIFFRIFAVATEMKCMFNMVSPYKKTSAVYCGNWIEIFETYFFLIATKSIFNLKLCQHIRISELKSRCDLTFRECTALRGRD